MNDLEKDFSDYFSYFGEVMHFWSSLQNKKIEILCPILNQTEQLRLSSRAQLDEDFLKRFPDAKEKLLGKIQCNIEEEMVALEKLQEEIKTFVDGLKIRLAAIENTYSKHNTDEARDFNPLSPANETLLEYAGDVWRCFHVLWIGIKAAIDTIDYYDKQTISDISDAFLKYNNVENQLQDIFDLTYHLRTSQNERG